MKKLLLLVTVFVFGTLGGHAQSVTPSELPHLTGAEYANSNSEDIHIILVGFAQCIPCKAAETLVFKSLSARYAQDAHVKVVKVDIDEDAAASTQAQQIKTLFQVQKYPTLLVVYHKGAMWRQEGFSMAQKQSTLDAIVDAVSKLK